MGEPRHADYAPITVQRILELPELRRGAPDVVAGRTGVGRTVRWVHSGEVRRIAGLLKGGELLLTTGMGIGDDAQDQTSFVAELAEREVAGVAIELGSRFASLPSPLVAAAERSGIPLIALRREVPFVEITEAAHRAIVNRGYELMRRADELHHRFSALLLEGAGIAEVLAALAGTIANPVLIETDRHGVLFHERHVSSDEAVMAAWEAASAGGDAPATLRIAIPMGAGETYGELIALAVDSPLTAFDRVAVEQAVGLVALALLRTREEEVLQARERGNVLAGLLEEQIDEVDAMAHAERLGFPTPDRMLPVVVAPSPRGRRDAPNLDDISWAALWLDIERELRSRRLPALHGVRPLQRELLLIVGAHSDRERAELAGQVSASVREAADRRLGRPDALVVCVAALARTWVGVRDGLREASACVPAAVRQPSEAWYDATRPSLDRLLSSLRDNEQLARFVDVRLGPLLRHDADRAVKLLPTLRAYCEHGGRRAETARALHLERQSLYHRIARIEELLAVDLRDAGELLGLHLALRAREHLPRR